MPIRVTLDRMLLERRMSLTELCDRVGITCAHVVCAGRRYTYAYAPLVP